MAQIKEILKLVDAGYTKEEIATLLAAEEKTEGAPLPPEPETAEPETAEPEPHKNDAAPVETSNGDMINKLADEIAELRKQIQKRNLNESYIETAKQDRSQEILAQLINPKKKEEKN